MTADRGDDSPLGRGPGGPATIRVLFVCTGNICRSAFAEVLARQLLVDRLGRSALDRFAFSSAGVRAVAGSTMHPHTRDALSTWGAKVHRMAGSFVARQLTEDMIVSADVILTAEESHRPAVAWVSSDALMKMYTMRRFARMLAAADQARLPPDPVERALRLVEQASHLQAALPPVPESEESVPDPVGGRPEQHLAMADTIFDVVATFVDVVAPLPPRRSV